MTPAMLVSNLRAAGILSGEMFSDSRMCTPGAVFLAFPGQSDDGRLHLADAVSRGAVAVVWEEEEFLWPGHLRHVCNFSVRGLREMAGMVADEFYGYPSKTMWACGATGTNGKTTTTQWLAAALDAASVRTMVVGTLGAGFHGQLAPTTHTTPDALELQRLLARHKKLGARAACLEVSSHALTQARISGVHFDCALFTNLTHDHLDYHGTMQAYGEAKAKLFHVAGLGAGVVNLDDQLGQQLAKDLRSRDIRCIGYSISPTFKRDSLTKEFIWAQRIAASRTGLRADISASGGQGVLELNHPGTFNLSNALAVLGGLLAYGLDFANSLTLMKDLPAVPGRMQRVAESNEPLVVVDYAHTPDALAKVIQALRPVVQMRGGFLWTVFGAGGDRDPSKRPLMGAIADELSDRVVVTSDNPRTEKPLDIIGQVLGGIDDVARVHSEPDREKAIEWAIRRSSPDDVVLIAGKGHETFQEIEGTRKQFSDVMVARGVLERMNGTSKDRGEGMGSIRVSDPRYSGGRAP